VKVEFNARVTVKHGEKRVHKRRTVVIGSARYKLSIGASRTIELSLSGPGKRALGEAKHHRLAVRIVATVAGGNRATRRETIMLAGKHKK
jgi:hypothetical protein